MATALEEFVMRSTLDVLVPQDSNFGVEDLQESTQFVDEHKTVPLSSTVGAKVLSAITTRNSLHFGESLAHTHTLVGVHDQNLIDEQIAVFVVLRTYVPDTDLLSYLEKLRITLEAQAFGSTFRNSNEDDDTRSAEIQNKDIIWTGTINASTAFHIIRENGQSCVLWKSTAFLSGFGTKSDVPALQR